MKKFQFHMQKLLSYKEQVLDGEMMNLADLNGLLGKTVQELKILQEDRERYKEEFEFKIKGHMTSAAYRIYDSYERHIIDRIELKKLEISNLEKQIEDQIEKVKGLKIETKSLETLKESKYEEYKKEEIKKEELYIEEFISSSKTMQKAN